ncbi:MMPL family transporter [Wenjunlia tyrosinilytica]|uniref:MMPL family transporter n=1 Tax=Wenjunlia tyrosinilytica TaxID=1544741 RepID=UPI001E5F5D4B|nr:MMPL family transporter [Wenjunlia tyrosinilytica]
MSHKHGGAKQGLAAAIGGWSARHRKTAVFGWLLLVALATVIGGMAGRTNLTEAEEVPGEFGRAVKILDEAGIEDPANEMVLVQARDGSVSAGDPAFRAAVDDIVAAVNRTGKVEHVSSPYQSGTVSKDKRSALVQFDMRGPADDASAHVQPVLDAVARVQSEHKALRIEEFGGASADKYFSDIVDGDFRKAEWTAVPLALGILLIAFGALVAALLPVALALTAFIGASGLVAVASHSIHTSDDASSVMLLVGLAVGVDYCLFYLRREREEREAGHDAQTALRIAAATSGRAVLVSGLTVMAAMAGMFFTGIGTFKAMGVATILVVLTAVVGSLTVLPALLSMLGDRVEKGRVPFLHRMKKNSDGSRFWRAVLTRVLGRPGMSAAVAGGALVLLAVPVIGLNTAHLTLQQEADDSVAVVQASNHINEAFPGGSEPAQVVVKADGITSGPVSGAIAAFKRQAVSSGASEGPVTVTLHKSSNVAVIDVPLAGDGNDSASEKALGTLRHDVVPATLGHVDGATTAIAGSTAASVDFSKQLGDGVVPVFGFVLALAAILMLLSFRSLTIAATTIVLNLLSVGAAYGVLTMVFQHGWGASLVGAEGVGAVQSWLPLFLFVILFGLSMDYHVFVLSRIKEAHEQGLATRAAIFRGITSTAGVVTSAAVIMVAVFAVFGTLSMQTMKQLGVGLAVAVLIDATLIRAVLLPAVMALLGERNWYLPKWLEWLPDLSEPAHFPPPPARPAPVEQPVPARQPDLV